TPRRHNGMLVHTTRYRGCEPLNTIPTKEIEQCKWYQPADFVSTYLNDEKFSFPSILLVFKHLRDSQMRELRWDKEIQKLYNGLKDDLGKDIDDLLFDLCFLEKVKILGFMKKEFKALIQDAANLAHDYLDYSVV
ncbi:MAG: hypothetical protein K940chlam3_01626, partial [Chlamydiae bacterium]|nr:hypothetical protein [Chlamydiota bacterium]